MIATQRRNLEEGPILDPAFIEHYWRLGRWPARWAARWLATKMRKLGVPAAARVLDIGCGPGWTVRFLAERFPGMTFVALDLSEPMLRRARKAGPGAVRPSWVRFVCGDGCRLPFRPAAFDLVMSEATLHHLGDPVPLLDEVDRVLAPNGHAIITDLNRRVPRVLWPLVFAADWFEKRLRPAAARSLSEGIVPSFRAAFDAGEIRRFLQASRLGRRVRYYPRVFGHWIQTPARSNNGGAAAKPILREEDHDAS